MSIDITAETESLGREEILSGHFRSVDEIIISGIHAWREKHSSTTASEAPPNPGEAMMKIDGLWVHQGQAEPAADGDRAVSNVRDERILDLLKASL